MSDTAGNMENGSFFVELLDIFVGGSTCNCLLYTSPSPRDTR